MNRHGSDPLTPFVGSDKELLTMLFEAYESGGEEALRSALDELLPEAELEAA